MNKEQTTVFPLVYVVDDDVSVRDSLAFMLEEHDFRVIAFEDGQAFLDSADTQSAGCVVLDSRMPKLRGQQVHQLLNAANSPLAVIYLTGHGDVPMAVEALRAGAVHFFQKPVKGDELADAIRQAFAQSLAKVEQGATRVAFNSLTQREKDILRLIIDGKRNIRIADELHIAMRTVEVHRASLLKKLGAKTVAELAYIYGKFSDQ